MYFLLLVATGHPVCVFVSCGNINCETVDTMLSLDMISSRPLEAISIQYTPSSMLMTTTTTPPGKCVAMVVVVVVVIGGYLIVYLHIYLNIQHNMQLVILVCTYLSSQ